MGAHHGHCTKVRRALDRVSRLKWCAFPVGQQIATVVGCHEQIVTDDHSVVGLA